MGEYAEAAYEGGFYTGNEGGRGGRRARNKGKNHRIREAAMKFARAWAKWHDHAGVMLDDDVLSAISELLDAMGVELEEGEDGKHRLVQRKGA